MSKPNLSAQVTSFLFIVLLLVTLFVVMSKEVSKETKSASKTSINIPGFSVTQVFLNDKTIVELNSNCSEDTKGTILKILGDSNLQHCVLRNGKFRWVSSEELAACKEDNEGRLRFIKVSQSLEMCLAENGVYNWKVVFPQK